MIDCFSSSLIYREKRRCSAKDRKNIKQSAENFPTSLYYQVDQLLTQLSIGEAFVTFLNQNGQPTMLYV